MTGPVGHSIPGLRVCRVRIGSSRRPGGPVPAGTYKVSYVYQSAADPYKKKAGLKYGKDVPEPWDVSPSNSSFTLDITK